MKHFILLPIFCFFLVNVLAQRTPGVRPELGNFSVLAGLHQPIVLRGGNIAFNYVTEKNLSLEASFGIGLDYANILSDTEKSLYQSISTPFSYGIGVGYFYKGFSLNFEPKGTMFRVVDYNDQVVNYTTWSLGGGLYYNLFLWKGLYLQPSIRYWHKVGSTLEGGSVNLVNSENGAFTHQARKPGNNGWIYGVSLGWYFK